MKEELLHSKATLNIRQLFKTSGPGLPDCTMEMLDTKKSDLDVQIRGEKMGVVGWEREFPLVFFQPENKTRQLPPTGLSSSSLQF